MIKQLNICTFNVRNDNLIPEKVRENIKEIYSTLLNENHIDILCTQEMIESTLNIIRKEFVQYKVIGSYRYGKNKILNNLKTLKKYNESNSIITTLPLLTEKTTELPWFPRNIKEFYYGFIKYKSITPRIITGAVLQLDDDYNIEVLNTHLDWKLETIQSLQLKKIVSIIKKSSNDIILTGDFNTTIENRNFKKFMKELDKLGLKRIEYNEKTFKKSKKNLAIDHIFIPKSWEIIEIKCIQESYLDEYSDHYPILIKVCIKK